MSAIYERTELHAGRQLPSLSRSFSLREFAERHDLAYGPSFGEGAWPEQNIHSDANAARREGLPGPVISAPQVFSMVNRIMQMCFREGWLAGGSLSLKMIKPVYVDELLTTKVVITEVADNGTGADECRVTCEVKVERRDGQPVCVGTASARVV